MSKKIISIFLILAIISGIGIVEAKNISKDNKSDVLDWKPVNKTIDIEKINLPIAESGIINSCAIIKSPGVYTLNTDVTNSSADACIIITSSNVLLDGKGHTIDGTDRIDTFGVYVHNPDIALYNVSVKNLKVIDWFYGIYYKVTINGILSNNIANSNIYGFFLDNYAGGNTLKNNKASFNHVGYSAYAGYNKLDNNTATTNDYGFVIYQTQKNNLINNVANYENNGYGFYLDKATNNILKNNKAVSYIGFELYSSNRNTIENNNATNSTQGIVLEYNSTNNTVRYNQFNGKELGIVLYYADYNTFIRNRIIGGGGIWIKYSDNNLLYDNLFNNTINFYTSFSINKWGINPKSCIINIVNGPLVAGNVWDTPNEGGFSQICRDDNHDGLCDSTFNLDPNNIDYRPEHNFNGDKTPPNTVSNLRNISYARNYIKWAWTDPTNADFSYVKVYIDGNFKCGVLNGVKAFNATGLLPNTIHTIGTKTVDTSGNEDTLKTYTSKTKP